MIVETDGELVTKSASGAGERARLAGEAAVLRAVAHPGVVRLVAVEGDRLVLGRVTGGVLSEVGAQPLSVVAGWGAAVATVLADVHALRFAHGAVTAEHVLFDERGRPVLCGWGAAGRFGAGVSPSGDVAALAGLIRDRLPPGERALRRSLAAWAAGGRRARSGGRGLARMLVRRVPDAQVAPVEAVEPASEPPVESAGRRSSRRGRWGAGAAVVGAGAVALGLASSRGGAPRAAGGPAAAAFVLQGGPGEQPVTVIGRWSCGPARPAVLDLRSGSVWVFAAWPAAGRAVRSALAARAAGADGLAVVSSGGGCDRLVALGPGVREMPVAVPGGS